MELSDLARRRSLLVAALAALRVKESMPEIEMMHRWLDNWEGVGLITTGMERQGHRLQLTNAEAGVWRATFSRHPMTSRRVRGSGDAMGRGAGGGVDGP